MQKQSSRGVEYIEVGEAGGQRVDNFLMAHLRGVPRSRIYRLLRKGEVRVNGGRVKALYRLRVGDIIRVPPVYFSEKGKQVYVNEHQRKLLKSAILFEDNQLLVLNKPAGWAVHGGSGINHGIIEIARALWNDPKLELAHHLDKGTSGCLLVAKSRAALKILHASLRERSMKKRYSLIVYGKWNSRVKTIRFPLHRFILPSGERRVKVASDGKPSRTDFEIKKEGSQATWLHAFPYTGRTHQIRVHCLANGHGIVGDEKYFHESSDSIKQMHFGGGLCLHADRIRVDFQGRELKFEAPLPESFELAWNRLSQD